jgi:hypothetical protein
VLWLGFYHSPRIYVVLVMVLVDVPQCMGYGSTVNTLNVMVVVLQVARDLLKYRVIVWVVSLCLGNIILMVA